MKFPNESDRLLPENIWANGSKSDPFNFKTFELSGAKSLEQESEQINSKLNRLCVWLFHSEVSPKTYLFLLFSNVVILLENLFFDGTFFLCLGLELVVTTLFSMEVYINYVLHGSKYYKSFEGMLDTTMVLLCLLFFLADGNLKNFILMADQDTHSVDVFEIFVCIMRLTTQSFRLARFYSRHKKNKMLFGEYIALPVVNTA